MNLDDSKFQHLSDQILRLKQIQFLFDNARFEECNELLRELKDDWQKKNVNTEAVIIALRLSSRRTALTKRWLLPEWDSLFWAIREQHGATDFRFSGLINERRVLIKIDELRHTIEHLEEQLEQISIAFDGGSLEDLLLYYEEPEAELILALREVVSSD
jgi:hypothetical protein